MGIQNVYQNGGSFIQNGLLCWEDTNYCFDFCFLQKQAYGVHLAITHVCGTITFYSNKLSGCQWCQHHGKDFTLQVV